MATLGLEEKKFDLKAGLLCLDFANTSDWHASSHPEESLNSYADLVSWAFQAGALTQGEAEALLRAAARRTREAADVLARAINFREAIYRIFSATAHGEPPAQGDLAIVNAEVAQAQGRLRLVPSDDGYAWGWAGGEALERMLWPVARSVAEVMTSGDLHRVGECADDRGCGWLFLDLSRNHSRRWCDMKSCGNRAKAKRHYQRKEGPREAAA